jgi:hypothetical protein
MKTTLKNPLLLTLVAAALMMPLRAQNTDAGTNGATPPGGPSQRGQGPMANLSEEDRQKVKAAHDAAIQNDPSLDQGMKDAYQAMEKARKAMHDAMIAVDPSVEAILAKMAHPKQGGWNKGEKNPGKGPEENGPKPWKHDGPGPAMANLTESEREQLKVAHEKVKNDPAVVAAREAKKNADTPEARRAAEEALHKASREAMIKEDPSLAPILEKLRPIGGRGGGGNGTRQTNAETIMQVP